MLSFCALYAKEAKKFMQSGEYIEWIGTKIEAVDPYTKFYRNPLSNVGDEIYVCTVKHTRPTHCAFVSQRLNVKEAQKLWLNLEHW
jgi:hypothetical protein